MAASSSSAFNFVISHNRRTIISSILKNNHSLLPISGSQSIPTKLPLFPSSKLTVCSVAKTIPQQVQVDQESNVLSPSSLNSSMFFYFFFLIGFS